MVRKGEWRLERMGVVARKHSSPATTDGYGLRATLRNGVGRSLQDDRLRGRAGPGILWRMMERTNAAAPAIDRGRLRDNLLELAEIGKDPEDRGIYRMAFTEAEMASKVWLEQKLTEAGLETWRDGAANVWGRLPGLDAGAAATVVGSHLDTVPCAGALDGSLGVLVALECLQSLAESGFRGEAPLELVAFSDEEGRFGGMLGSQAVCGQANPEMLHASDLDGHVLEDVLRSHGMNPMEVLSASRAPETVSRYLEVHIEQGPVLDRRGVPLGVVDEITGLFKWGVHFRGEPNHAGTTPMEMRRDAFMGLADFAHEIPRLLEENGSPRSRATIGKAEIQPGAPNTVPGRVEFSLDVRDTDPQVMRELSDAMRRALSAIARRRDLQFDFEQLSWIDPVRCDPALVEILETSAREAGLEFLRMPSGAAHDAQIMASLTRIGMLFVPSKGGISHSPAEWTDWADIEAGATVLLAALQELL